MPRSGAGAGVTVVGSRSRSFDGSESLATVTVAALITPGTAAPSTATVSVKLVEPPIAIGAPWIAVTIGPATAKLQPAPLPATKVRPAGSVSVTVVAPAVAAGPRLVTPMV